jgi:hypothetical protein
MGVYEGQTFDTQFTAAGAVSVYTPSQQADLAAFSANMVDAQNHQQFYSNAFNQDHLNYEQFLATYWQGVYQKNLDAYNAEK